MLNATWIWSKLTKDSNNLTFAFESATPDDTLRLGGAFAPVLEMPADENAEDREVLRVGMVGDSAVGKSSLVKGMLDALPDRKLHKSSPRTVRKDVDNDETGTYSPEKAQGIWYSEKTGWICHYDAYLAGAKERLPSLADEPNAYMSRRVDLVEHSEIDTDENFNCLISMRTIIVFDLSPPKRVITVMASRAFAGSPAFQEFLRQAAPFSAKPASQAP